jgi:hypothetical protein
MAGPIPRKAPMKEFDNAVGLLEKILTAATQLPRKEIFGQGCGLFELLAFD